MQVKEGSKSVKVKEGDVMLEAEVRVDLLAGFEDGRGSGLKEQRKSLEVGKDKETDHFLEPLEGTQPC